MMHKCTLHAIAAVDSGNGIGYDNRLLFKDPLDMAWFYNITLGHTVIMGRKTYESMGGPLPNRRNIVMSMNDEFDAPDAEVVHGCNGLHLRLTNVDNAYVIGGEQIYRLLLPCCDYIHLTTFHEIPELVPNRFFPAIDENVWKICSSVVGGTFRDGSVRLKFETFRRKDNG